MFQFSPSCWRDFDQLEALDNRSILVFQFSPSCWRDFDTPIAAIASASMRFNLVPRVGGISTSIQGGRSPPPKTKSFNLVPRVGGISTAGGKARLPGSRPFQFSPSCWRDFDFQLWDAINREVLFQFSPSCWRDFDLIKLKDYRTGLSCFNLVPRVGGIST